MPDRPDRAPAPPSWTVRLTPADGDGWHQMPVEHRIKRAAVTLSRDYGLDLVDTVRDTGPGRPEGGR